MALKNIDNQTFLILIWKVKKRGFKMLSNWTSDEALILLIKDCFVKTS